MEDGTAIYEVSECAYESVVEETGPARTYPRWRCRFRSNGTAPEDHGSRKSILRLEEMPIVSAPGPLGFKGSIIQYDFNISLSWLVTSSIHPSRTWNPAAKRLFHLYNISIALLY
jgi:hypothetical protein